MDVNLRFGAGATAGETPEFRWGLEQVRVRITPPGERPSFGIAPSWRRWRPTSRSGARWGWTGEWRRTYARFFPDAEPFAVLTLEGAGRMLRVDVLRRSARSRPPSCRARRSSATTPGAAARSAHGDRFGKVDDVGPELLDAQRELWAHRHELGFAVAEPLGYDATTRTLWLARGARRPAAADAGARRADGRGARDARTLERPAGRARREPPDHARASWSGACPRSATRVEALLADPLAARARRGRSTARRTRRSGCSTATRSA